jgi:hypothetical protein
MNRPHFALLAGILPGLLVLLGPSSAAGAPAMEKRILFGPESAKQWAAAESTVEASAEHKHTDQPSLRWHITVDYFSGEAKYPIGWPRIGLTFKDPAARDWSGWDFLEMWIYTDTSRERLPREPLSMALYAPDKAGGFNRMLDEVVKGQWAQIRIPLTQIPRHNDVRFIQFSISEARYKHQDQIDFYFGEVALLRYAKPTLLDFSAVESVMFADRQRIPIRFDLTGIKPNEPAEVVCELRQGSKVAAKVTTKAMRGAQRVVLDLGQARLSPGEYVVVASVAGGEPATAKVRLVESPWQKAEK